MLKKNENVGKIFKARERILKTEYDEIINDVQILQQGALAINFLNNYYNEIEKCLNDIN